MPEKMHIFFSFSFVFLLYNFVVCLHAFIIIVPIKIPKREKINNNQNREQRISKHKVFLITKKKIREEEI